MDYLALSIILSVAGIAFGLFMVLRPALIIKMHIKSTEKSNWRLEPISMEKELRNTKISGINLAAVCILAITYIKLCL